MVSARPHSFWAFEPITEEVNIGDRFHQTEELVIRLSSSTEWVYLDLDNQCVVNPSSPQNSLDWDLAFRHLSVKVNGGISGTGGVEVRPLCSQYDSFSSHTKVPIDGWTTDQIDPESEVPNFAFAGWFDTSVGNPANVMYFIKSVEDSFYRLRFKPDVSPNRNERLVIIEIGKAIGL